MAEEIICDRRRFLRAAIVTFAAAKPFMLASLETKMSFSLLKQIDAGVLNRRVC